MENMSEAKAIPNLTQEQQDTLNGLVVKMTTHEKKANELGKTFASLSHNFSLKSSPTAAQLAEVQAAAQAYFMERRAEREAMAGWMRQLREYNKDRGQSFPDAWQKIIDDVEAGR